jgi:hypothetical protein
MRAKAMHFLFLLGACVLAAGCIIGTRMQPPEDLVGENEVLEVTDRSQFGRGLLTSEEFDLGPYRVSDVDRDWNKTRGSAKDLWFFEGRKVQTKSVGGFSFSFDLGGAELSASCDTAVLSKAYKFGSWSVAGDSQSMGCRCRSGANIVSSLWVVDAKAGTQWSGWLSLGDIKYQLVGDKRLEGNKTSAGPAGYLFDGDGSSPVRAIDIMHPGRVWLHKNLSPEDRVAAGCAAAAILLESTPRTES